MITTSILTILLLGGIPGQADAVRGGPADSGLPTGSTSGCASGTDEDGRLPDLYCIDLFPAAGLRDAGGVVELRPPTSPFGVAVSRDGALRYHLRVHIDGLPEPSDLGAYSAYVAWATTPVFEPVVKLGEVGNGTVDLGEVDLNEFLLLISAEPHAGVETRTGRLVLRGRSPSMLMEAHDLLTVAPDAVLTRGAPSGPARERPPGEAGAVPGEAEGTGRHAGADAHPAGRVWTTPPMHPEVPMLAGLRGSAPSVSPFLPDVTAAGGVDRIPEARPRRLIDLPDGGTLDVEAGLVRRTIGDRTVVMYGFNGQYPGPLIRVPEGATIFVRLTNRTELPTTIHWHGVRLDNRFDGVPGVTQKAVMPGESFRYRVHFPDPGIYWYHPHHREDVQQELGLYGNLVVESPRPDYYSPVNREAVLMLDDLLLGDEGLVPFGAGASNYTLMGRFGNLFLINGEPGWEMEVARGEVVRFFLTNVSNTRTFNLTFGDLPIKVVGTDVGKFEHEEWAESVVISPAERYIVEVRFPKVGDVRLQNRVQAVNHRYGVYMPEVDDLGVVHVRPPEVPEDRDHRRSFERLRDNDEVIRDIDRYRGGFERPPERELLLTLETRGLPEVVERVMQFERAYFNPLEWSGTMPMMNWLTTGDEVRWILRDPTSGAENMEIDWRFRVGDTVKIRLRNDRQAFHAMQHPLHIHGQRFLVLARNGVPNPNLAWKDTVLLPVGSTTDILLELSNPGSWMVHCHIAEHLESGMKLVMEVEE